MKWSLNGKVALITGATKGIGYAIAEEFMNLGAKIYIVARTKSAVEEVVDTWQKKGKTIKGIVGDVSNGQEGSGTAMS